MAESGVGQGAVLVQEPVRRQWVFQIYNPSSGNPTANEGCYYVDARQYAIDNPQAIQFCNWLESSGLQLTNKY